MPETIPPYRPRVPPLYIDVDALANDVFGSRVSMHEAILQAGYTLAKPALDKWVHRARIPGDWWPRLFYVADFHDLTLEPRKYLRTHTKYNPSGREIRERRQAFEELGLPAPVGDEAPPTEAETLAVVQAEADYRDELPGERERQEARLQYMAKALRARNARRGEQPDLFDADDFLS